MGILKTSFTLDLPSCVLLDWALPVLAIEAGRGVDDDAAVEAAEDETAGSASFEGVGSDGDCRDGECTECTERVDAASLLLLLFCPSAPSVEWAATRGPGKLRDSVCGRAEQDALDILVDSRRVDVCVSGSCEPAAWPSERELREAVKPSALFDSRGSRGCLETEALLDEEASSAMRAIASEPIVSRLLNAAPPLAPSDAMLLRSGAVVNELRLSFFGSCACVSRGGGDDTLLVDEATGALSSPCPSDALAAAGAGVSVASTTSRSFGLEGVEDCCEAREAVGAAAAGPVSRSLPLLLSP